MMLFIAVPGATIYSIPRYAMLLEALREQVLHANQEIARRGLAPHKVPAMVRIVPSLEVSAAGKLVRPSA